MCQAEKFRCVSNNPFLSLANSVEPNGEAPVPCQHSSQKNTVCILCCCRPIWLHPPPSPPTRLS